MSPFPKKVEHPFKAWANR